MILLWGFGTGECVGCGRRGYLRRIWLVDISGRVAPGVVGLLD